MVEGNDCEQPAGLDCAPPPRAEWPSVEIGIHLRQREDINVALIAKHVLPQAQQYGVVLGEK